MARIPARLSEVNTAYHPYRESRPAAPELITDYLSLACFLVASGHRVDVRPAGKGTVLFCFDQRRKLADDVEAFFRGGAAVDPTKYDSVRAALRRRIDVLNRGVQ